jgi:hypothetical protein
MVQEDVKAQLLTAVGSMLPGAPSGDLLWAVRTDAALRDAISKARLIVIQVRVGEFASCSDALEAVPPTQAAIDACLDPVIDHYEG